MGNQGHMQGPYIGVSLIPEWNLLSAMSTTTDADLILVRSGSIWHCCF